MAGHAGSATADVRLDHVVAGAARRGSSVASAELFARTDPELREHLAQVPLDRARADEKLCADLGVRASLGGEPCDLRLLRGEAVARLGAALAHRLAGGHPFTAGAFGEPVHADLRIHAVRNPELLARVHAPAFASQPLTVEEVRTRKRGTHPRAAQPRDRLAVQALGNVGLAEQRA